MDFDVLMSPDLSSILIIRLNNENNYCIVNNYSLEHVHSSISPSLWGGKRKGEHEGKEGWVGRGCREDGWGTERLQRQKDTGWLTGRRKGLQKLSRETDPHRAGEWKLFFTFLICRTCTHTLLWNMQATDISAHSFRHTHLQTNWSHIRSPLPAGGDMTSPRWHCSWAGWQCTNMHCPQKHTHTQAQQACPWSLKVYREIYLWRTHSLAHCLLPPQSSSGPPIILSSFASLADTSR